MFCARLPPASEYQRRIMHAALVLCLYTKYYHCCFASLHLYVSTWRVEDCDSLCTLLSHGNHC